MRKADKRSFGNIPSGVRFWIGVAFCALLLLITGILAFRSKGVTDAAMTAVSPVRSIFVSVEQWIVDHTDNLKTLQQVVNENNALREQVEALKEENRILQNQTRRTSELEDLYEMDTYYRDYPKTAAQIIGLSPNNWYETFILDKGAQEGMEQYMPILSNYGLAGHISEVYEHYSVITSVINQNSVIYGQINRQDGDLVVVQGANGYRISEIGTVEQDMCMIHFVSNEVDITVGDEIVTSTLGDIYPPGLSIGTVIQIIPVGTGYESIALVKPTSILEQVDMVLVITELWKSELYEEPAQEDAP